MARLVTVGQGRQGVSGRVPARFGMARFGVAGMARQGKAGLGKAWQGLARHGRQSRFGTARQGVSLRQSSSGSSIKKGTPQ